MWKEGNLVAPSHCMKEWHGCSSLFSNLIVSLMHSKEASFLSSSKVNPELIYINFQFMKKKKEPGLEHYYLQLLLQAFCSHFEPYPLHAGKQVSASSWLHGDRNWTSTIVSFDWQTLSYAYNIVESPSVNDKLCWDKNLNHCFVSINSQECLPICWCDWIHLYFTSDAFATFLSCW